MNFIAENLDNYIVNHSENEPQILQELYTETWQKMINPRMTSGHYQGRILAMLAKLIQPKTILEIGTYTGYATLCLAEGLNENGIIHTIDRNEELYDFQSNYFSKSNYTNQIKQHTGNALDIIPTIEHKFDLVFIDADKINYSNYFDLIIDKMNKGGIILSDNVLWSGKVIEPLQEKDMDTRAILAYNKKLKEDKRIETVILPIRDGLTISRIK
jgi:predicted O-methyltransferase YrrM